MRDKCWRSGCRPEWNIWMLSLIHIYACQYSFIFPLSPNDMHDLCRLYEKAGAINESEQDEIINNGRGRAFVVTSPSERSSIDIETPKDIERLFGI